jgi:sodium-dependent dicarboxylate transporter 2/3/5
MSYNYYFLLLGVILFLSILSCPVPEGLSVQGVRVIAVIVLMLTWWLSEAVPIPVTALLPIVLLPILGVDDLKSVTSNYGHPIVFLFFGGFVIAIAMQKWGLHKRIALNILRRTGTHANGIILGFMLATAFLSMWISNTATTVMMLPIAYSVLTLILGEGADKKSISKPHMVFSMSLMVAIAFAANIGGTATLTGTPPNAIFAGYIENTFGYEISFATWMAFGLPFSLLMLGIAWWVICFLVYPSKLGRIDGAEELIAKEYLNLGKMSSQEKAVCIVFCSTALLWIFKGLLPISNVKDTMISVGAAIVLFLIPQRGKPEFLLNWDDMKALPWGILLLFGGGLSIAGAMGKVGLIEIVGQNISSLSMYGLAVVIFVVIASVLLLTECMSNLALITIFLPVLGGVALALGENPLLFAIPATLASSCAFMLPMATPPNAIVFASGYIRIIQMAKVGLVMNMLSILMIFGFSYTLLLYVFGINLGNVPAWAEAK